MYRNLASYLWIPLVLLLLVPVFRSSILHRHLSDQSENQGQLHVGRNSLDILLAESEGRPVIVNFWATWCTPCVGELPHIDEVYMEFDGSVLAVAVDIGDPELETLIQFRENLMLSMPVVWLGSADAQRLKEEWELPDVLPVTVILGPGGEEVDRVAGSRDIDYFRNAVSGEILPDTADSTEPAGVLHINVVGSPDDSLTALLLEASVRLAGEYGVDVFDPSLEADSLLMENLYLPMTGYPYAQPCVGDMCGRPSHTPEELQQAVSGLQQ